MTKISRGELVDFIKHQIVKECGVPYNEIDEHVPFINFNMDSVKAVFIMDQLEKYLKTELSPLYFWDNPTIDLLTTFLLEEVIRIKE
jgi:acyl carrier protein